MSSPNGHEPTGSYSSSRSVDRICDQFEAAWRAGQHPQIEEALAQASATDRPFLLRELLEIELQIRQRTGELLKIEDYRRRFPADTALVDAVFPQVVKCTRLGDYELLEELGRGGMGVVYRARQPFLDKFFAIKVLPDRYLEEPQAIARFRREMHSIAAVDHPNIVRAYNAGEEAGVHFLVMEYVEGASFQRLVTGHGPLGLRAACEAVRQAALGLQHVYEQGLVHRDIKPGNLMLNRAGVVKILDLGLAKLHVDQPGDDRDVGQLTKTGTTLGTVDYMAPEQWENSAEVDIRADIYSLGCTLFFLITGRAPYADGSHGSGRKRLMAHMMAPVPSLCDYCQECPLELDEILTRMMAKDAADRIQTPGEVAEAIDAFADFDELAAYAESAIRTGREAGRPGSAVRGVVPDTARPSTPTPRRGRSSDARRPPPWYRRTSTLLVVATVGASIVVALSVLIGRSMRPGREEEQKPPPVAPAVVTHREPAATPRHTGQQLTEEICTLPSLNGGWWFNEMPWLVPVVRKAMADQFSDPQSAAEWLAPNSPLTQGLSSPNTVPLGRTLRHWTNRLCETPAGPGALRPRQVALVLALMSAAEANLTDEKLADRWRTSMDAFSRGDGREGSMSAEDLHTLAVLQHSLAVLGNDAEMTKTAKQTYLQALKEYTKTGGSALQRLCRADYARLYADRPGSGAEVKDSYAEVRRLCEKALAGLKDDQLVLFRADTLIIQGNAAALAATNANEYGDCDHAFRTAEEMLTAAGLKEHYHPLLAYAWECYAWCNMDRWMIDEAKDLFTRASENRRQNLENRENRVSLIHELHDRHGIAIVKRYRGQLINAIADFIEVLDDTRRALQADRISTAHQRYVRDLRERLYNSSERFGDAFLYQGAASDIDRERLRRACELYQTAYDEAEDRAVKVSMGYKRAIMLALMNKQSAADVAADVKELDRSDLGPEAERGGLLRQVAHAVIALQVAGLEAGQRRLCDFLTQFYDGSVRVDWKKRETLELQLFCAELLLTSELKDPKGAAAAGEHIKYLDKLIREFPFAAQRIPYLWRYIDLAVRVVGQAHPEEGLRYVLMLRDPPQDPSAALLAFQMHNDAGIAFFRSQGKVEAFLISEVGRQKIRRLERKGDPLPLDGRLVAAVTARLREGQRVTVLWQEDESRVPFGKALTNEDWPFSPPLAALSTPSAASGPRSPGKAESPAGVPAVEPPATHRTRTRL